MRAGGLGRLLVVRVAFASVAGWFVGSDGFAMFDGMVVCQVECSLS